MRGLIRLLAIRPGEGALVGLVALVFGTVEAARGFGEVGADTLFLTRVGASHLPELYVALGLIGLVVVVGYGGAIGRLPLARLLVGVLVGMAAILALLRLVLVTSAPFVLPALWLAVYVIGAVLGTSIWVLGGAAFDARQAKRLFPLCTSAAILGGFVGTLLAGPLARVAGVENLVLVDAGLLALSALVTARIGGRLRRQARARRDRAPLSAELRAGFDFARRSPLMRLVAVAYVLFAVLFFSVSFPFLQAMATAFPSEGDLATALGLLSAAVTGASFVISLVLANRVYARFGVASAALVLPVIYLLGFATWLIQFSVVTAVAFRFAQQVTQRGLSNAAWSAFYNTVPAERRAQVLAFNDGIPGQLGISLSGVLLIVAGGLLTRSQIFVLGVVAALACTVVVVRIRRRYGESILSTLRAGLGEQVLEGGPGLGTLIHDPQVVGQLARSLGDPNPSLRRFSAGLLGRLGARERLDDLLELLRDTDPSVRCAAIRAIASLAPDTSARTRLSLCLHDPDPAVRGAAIDALAPLVGPVLAAEADRLAADESAVVRAALSVALVGAGEEQRPHAILAALLESPSEEERLAGLDAVARLRGHAPSPHMGALLQDPSAAVRAAALRGVAAVEEGLGDPTPALAAALDDEAQAVRLAAARALNDRFGAARATILEALLAGSERVQEGALMALTGNGPAVREPLLEWASRQVVRAERLRACSRLLRDAVASTPGLGNGDGRGSSAEFLAAVLHRREWEIEVRLLRALALLGATDASGLIRRCLRSNDAETRAQAIEALDSLGDRRLGRQIVELLEGDAAEVAGNPGDILRALAEDPDPWVRALALRTLSGWLLREREAVVDRVRRDPDAIVRSAVDASAVGDGGSGMPTTHDTLGEMDRMLFLRRVPLFSELSPEDLQRIASAAAERFYPVGEPIVREGELGDELVVIVEGTVRVVRGKGGGQRLLRTYGPGDHIGELAILSERPRAATVIAEEPGVRGLVIDGDGLRAILRERPEAAMAMLATLAERLGAQ